MSFLNKLQNLMDATRKADFLGPLALRLYLVPVFWVAGTNKIRAPGTILSHGSAIRTGALACRFRR